jgi:serine/threonine-protein kinase HipA
MPTLKQLPKPRLCHECKFVAACHFRVGRFNLDKLPLKGERVGFYFDNLLPEADAIRCRQHSRFHTRAQDAFDLLEAIGRDCVGAVQLLPEGQTPKNVFSIEAETLDDEALERLLRAAVSSALPGQAIEADDFRISLAGAQEKTALPWHEGRWCRPLGATPTTHVFKFPLGLVVHRQADLRTSVENEWLCTQILTAYGVPVAPCEIRHFGEQKALVVERFGRKLHSSTGWWLRLPQEDFCQVSGHRLDRTRQLTQAQMTSTEDAANRFRQLGVETR